MKQKYFNLAEKLAKKSDHPSQKHAAVIVRRGEILGLGINKLKTHPRSPDEFRFCHAEFSATLNAGLEDLTGAEVYVLRRRKDGILGNSKPCKNCEGLLKTLGVKTVYYSVEEGFKKENYG